MKIAITGATGFIGTHLTQHLIMQGHDVIWISRHHPKSDLSIPTYTWTQLRDSPELLEGTEAIVNLAGESINQRWNDAAKKRIVQSRLAAAEALSEVINRLSTPPRVVIQASGMSIYGISETETFDERSPATICDFLSSVVEKWEQGADLFTNTRVVKVRVGIVLGMDGGAFPKMLMPYRLFVGGKIGTGRQWLSWIHIEDMVRLIEHCMLDERIQGPVNATAPNPMTNQDFGKCIAKVLHRPNLFPVPSIMFKLMFGELSTLLLDGQRVLPYQLEQHGFIFKYPELEQALQDLLAPATRKEA
ncbi:TIGR01777 family oxidoreductase [Paenibacillus sp. N1-5-1-14]|uniref:TIGR01777 family oxidoreductase n=1 Tax=Paenibacillus radicibacter TaxID=2972488 RepID=UPI002159137B|nr:TIGR01777 family oxidoreductase [Paenibacillus radicibacter]MCR8643859.1 TIGR01777 family oxidoreductase [Paenibacillus radicibacter]